MYVCIALSFVCWGHFILLCCFYLTYIKDVHPRLFLLFLYLLHQPLARPYHLSFPSPAWSFVPLDPFQRVHIHLFTAPLLSSSSFPFILCLLPTFTNHP
ncbi:hypothetical protein F5H01DRAFT_333252 [Linnemannia elongata]|nr:hypothetical protein F5H01DRAFT_333252 [Linnemannia elongata]